MLRLSHSGMIFISFLSFFIISSTISLRIFLYSSWFDPESTVAVRRAALAPLKPSFLVGAVGFPGAEVGLL